MENVELVVLRKLRDWRLDGQCAALATVLRTWGSSPRPIGSIMAFNGQGAVVGSVSGGCIEDDLIHSYTGEASIRDAAPQIVKYGVAADHAHRFGLPCGGTLELLLEFNPDGRQLADLVAQLQAGKLVRRVVSTADGLSRIEEASAPAALVQDDQQVAIPFGPEFRMLLIGAGQLAEYLATMATFSGFSVTVCDPRQEYAGHWNCPGTMLTRAMPDDAVNEFRPDRRSCVIALTHDPKLDDLALIDALRTEAFYVGAIGSRRNNTARRDRLREHFGLSTEELARLRGPIGLYIGSKTPPEIAVSVMAEVIAVKNAVRLPRHFEVDWAKNAQEAEKQVSPGV